MEAPARRSWALAALIPVAVVAAAYGLWWISDRLLYVGPLDRAAFGWIVVVPLMLAAPIVAGLAWSRLDTGGMVAAALTAATLVGLAAAFLLWRGVSEPGCETAPTRLSAELILPSLVVGSLVGLGIGIGGSVSARFFKRGNRLGAVVAGVAMEAAFLTLSVVALGQLYVMTACQRPT
jgi:hypothetical protein